MITTHNLMKTYAYADTASVAVNDISISIEEGEFVAIMGKSGCGKTTLLNILGGLIRPTSGEISFLGQRMERFSTRQLCELRRQMMGFIVQKFALIPNLTAYQNIALPLEIRKVSREETKYRVHHIAERLGMEQALQRYPVQLSGGECQRIAIARAVIANPKLILADEPTGALDTKSSYNVMDILSQIHQEGATILLVTHDKDVAACAQRTLYMKDGCIVNEQRRSCLLS